MVKACDEAERVVICCEAKPKKRYVAAPKARGLRMNEFGKINMVHLNVFWTSLPQEYYDQAKWRGTWEFDGGVIYESMQAITWIYLNG